MRGDADRAGAQERSIPHEAEGRELPRRRRVHVVPQARLALAQTHHSGKAVLVQAGGGDDVACHSGIVHRVRKRDRHSFASIALEREMHCAESAQRWRAAVRPCGDHRFVVKSRRVEESHVVKRCVVRAAVGHNAPDLGDLGRMYKLLR